MKREVVQVTGATPFSRGRGPELETLPKKRVVFPAAGVAAGPGGIIGRSPVTPELEADRTIASFAVTRFRLEAPSLLSGITWKKITVDRPTIIMSLTTETPSTTVQAPCIILYNYGKIPDERLVAAQSLTAERGGICLLSQPGEWYLAAWAEDLEQAQYLDCLQFDASNPHVADRFLRQPGVNVQTETHYALTDNTVATLIPFGGRYVRAVTVQNVPPMGAAGEVVRYVVGQPSTTLVAGAAWTGNGFRLLVNGSVSFEGDALTRFGLYAVMESASAAALEVVRYLDR